MIKHTLLGTLAAAAAVYFTVENYTALNAGWAVVCMITAGIFYVSAAENILKRLVLAVGDLLVDLFHPQLEEMRIIKSYDEHHMTFFLWKQAADIVMDHDAMTFYLVKSGRKLSKEFIFDYLEDCRGWYQASNPSFPSLDRVGNGSKQQLDERAFIQILIDGGRALEVSGQRFAWVPGHDPITETDIWTNVGVIN